MRAPSLTEGVEPQEAPTNPRVRVVRRLGD